MHEFKENKRLNIVLYNPKATTKFRSDRVSRARAKEYKFVSVLVCIKSPDLWTHLKENPFTILKPYICLCMKESHPNYNPRARSKFAIYNGEINRGICMSANMITQHFKPLTNGKEEIVWGK